MYEKEINLLKQSEYLLKTQEDSKSFEVASTIQAKLSHKNGKIETLKLKLNTAEQSAEALRREKAHLEEEKGRLENEHITLITKYEQQSREVKKLEAEFFQIRSKMSSQELALEKVSFLSRSKFEIMSFTPSSFLNVEFFFQINFYNK